MKREEYIKWVEKNHPAHMTTEEYLEKYPPHEDMDPNEMEDILMRGPRTEEEMQKLSWYHESWIDPEDRVQKRSFLMKFIKPEGSVQKRSFIMRFIKPEDRTQKKAALMEAKEQLEEMKSSSKGKSK